MCNPIGASKGKFKVVGMYMMLANLPPYLRTKLENIKLVFLCYHKHIQKFGWSEILKVLMKDLMILENEGISFEFLTYKGSVLVVTGDNLGNHEISGFSENFSTVDYFCRYCEEITEDLKTDFFTVGRSRTEKSYEKCAVLAEKEVHW